MLFLCFSSAVPSTSKSLLIDNVLVKVSSEVTKVPLAESRQVVCHGVKVVGVHGEEGKEKYGEVRREVTGEVEQLREKRSSWMVWGWKWQTQETWANVGVMYQWQRRQTSNSVQACSDLAHVVLVLVRRVTVVYIVHIGLDEVVVVFRSRFVRELLY